MQGNVARCKKCQEFYDIRSHDKGMTGYCEDCSGHSDFGESCQTLLDLIREGCDRPDQFITVGLQNETLIIYVSQDAPDLRIKEWKGYKVVVRRIDPPVPL